MATDNAFTWDRLSAWYQANAQIPTDVATYGSDIPTEADLRLCGDVASKRILDLGCGGGQCAIAFARQGARVIAVDHSAEQLTYARRLADGEGVKVELRQSDMADLAFVTTASIDLVFSSWALCYVDDIGRVFRQVHRVLRTNAPFVFSLPHPASRLVSRDSDEPLLVRRGYWDHEPLQWEWNGVPVVEYQHTVAELFTGLQRSNFAVDTLLEPEPVAGMARHPLHWHDNNALIPSTLIIRARKLGI